MIRLIAAMDARHGIAGPHGIPWQGRIPTDMRYFMEQTREGTIVMGYGTYEEFDHPLHDRQNFVVARPGTKALRPGFLGIPDLAAFLRQRQDELVWVIGGAAIFTQSMPIADELYITQLGGDFHCIKFFPSFDGDFLLVTDTGPYVENDISLRFETWRRTGDASREIRPSR